jgi:hypothetical protein
MNVFHGMPLDMPGVSPVLPGKEIIGSHLSSVAHVTIFNPLVRVAPGVGSDLLGVPGVVSVAPNAGSPDAGWPARFTMAHSYMGCPYIDCIW